MKKTLALLLALVLIVASAPAAFATSETSQSIKLTTTVPSAAYTLNIPTDTEIVYGAKDTSIGYLTITDSRGFFEGKNVKVELKGDKFSSKTTSTYIPYSVGVNYTSDLNTSDPATSHHETAYNSGRWMIFRGTNNGNVERLAYDSYGGTECYVGDLGILISASAWCKALAGDYTSTITFTASVTSAS